VSLHPVICEVTEIRLDMNIIICEDKCPICNAHFVKTPLCNGDYYPVESGMTLMRFCPICGNGKPEVEGRDPDYISRNKKKAFGVIVGEAFCLGYKETKEDALSIDTNNKQDFIKLFSQRISEKTGVPPIEILKCFD